jgi:DNA-3-methyladenine glycosylase II
MERRVEPLGTYSLAASTVFLEGYVPAGYTRPTAPGHLHLAFPVDAGSGDAVAAVCARQPDDPAGAVILEAVADDDDSAEAALDQLTQILSLDTDGRGYEAVGARDAAIGRLQARYPGLRPVLFHSPYEAAAWAIIGTRIAIRQAARVKSAMAERLGTTLEIHGESIHAFPTPAALSTMEYFPGLFGRKTEYLRGIAAAAMAGRLRRSELRALPEADALARLQELGGIGPFGAELTLLRGVGTTDRAPYEESRLGRAIALAYDRDEPTRDEGMAITDGWRPFRTWVTLLVRTNLEETTHEIRDGRPLAGPRGGP